MFICSWSILSLTANLGPKLCSKRIPTFKATSASRILNASNILVYIVVFPLHMAYVYIVAFSPQMMQFFGLCWGMVSVLPFHSDFPVNSSLGDTTSVNKLYFSDTIKSRYGSPPKSQKITTSQLVEPHQPVDQSGFWCGLHWFSHVSYYRNYRLNSLLNPYAYHKWLYTSLLHKSMVWFKETNEEPIYV